MHNFTHSLRPSSGTVTDDKVTPASVDKRNCNLWILSRQFCRHAFRHWRRGSGLRYFFFGGGRVQPYGILRKKYLVQCCVIFALCCLTWKHLCAVCLRKAFTKVCTGQIKCLLHFLRIRRLSGESERGLRIHFDPLHTENQEVGYGCKSEDE